MPAPSRVSRILSIDDIVLIHKCKSVQSEKGFHLSYVAPYLFYRAVTLIGNEIHSFFHLVKIIVYQVCYDPCAAFRHCLKVEGADRRDRFIRRITVLLHGPKGICGHEGDDDDTADNGGTGQRSVFYHF